MLTAVLFQSQNRERFENFKARFEERGVAVTVLDFDDDDWIAFDYAKADFAVYFPTFEFTSNHPQALVRAKENWEFLAARHPHLVFFPDPNVVRYYNDKYRQYLYLRTAGFPYPRTLALTSEASVDKAARELGFPLVVKNRFGAGGDQVFRVSSRDELADLFRLSRLDVAHWAGVKHFGKMATRREFYWHLLKDRKAAYPLLSPPLLAQEFLHIDRDLKTVTGYGKVREAHWRYPADPSMWKVNIDGGGVGVWARIPQEAFDISEGMARELNASWLNIDLLHAGGRLYVSEFSPVWHHYRYKEKPSFVYEDDYNVDTPLEEALDLERLLVESLVVEARRRGRA